jgi:hypothetical protein
MERMGPLAAPSDTVDGNFGSLFLVLLIERCVRKRAIHDAGTVCFELLSRMGHRPNGVGGPRGRLSSRRAGKIAGAGCRRERHSAGAGECAWAQRLGQRSERHRQRGQSAGDPAAGHQPRSRPSFIRPCGDLQRAAGAGNGKGENETNAICDIEVASRGQIGRQGSNPAHR